jgi:hypothetical protein
VNARRRSLSVRYVQTICVEGLRKTTKILSQHTRSPGRDSKPEPPENETGVLTDRAGRPVIERCCLCHKDRCLPEQ